MRGSRYLLTLGVSAGLLSGTAGCVRKSVYEKAMADLQAANQQGVIQAQQLTECKADARAVESMSSDYQAQLARADAELTRLKGLTADLSAELGDTRTALEAEKRRAGHDDGLEAAYRALTSRLAGPIKSGQLEVLLLGGHLRVALIESALFTGTRSEVSPGGRTLVADLAHALAASPHGAVFIESVRDDIDAGTKKTDDWKLSMARAAEVARAMIAAGMGAEQVKAGVVAEIRRVPSAAGPSPAARRLEVLVLPTAR